MAKDGKWPFGQGETIGAGASSCNSGRSKRVDTRWKLERCSTVAGRANQRVFFKGKREVGFYEKEKEKGRRRVRLNENEFWVGISNT